MLKIFIIFVDDCFKLLFNESVFNHAEDRKIGLFTLPHQFGRKVALKK